MMKSALLAAAAAIAPTLAAAAAESQTVCTRGAVTRSIEILSPGMVGARCDVVYRKPNEGAPATTPYHANNNYDYCVEKAADLAQVLSDAGWSCAAVETDLAALDAPVAPRPDETPAAPAAEQRVAEVAAAPTPAPEQKPEAATSPAEPAPVNREAALREAIEPTPAAPTAEPEPVRAAPTRLAQNAGAAATETAPQTPPQPNPKPEPAAERIAPAPTSVAQRLAAAVSPKAAAPQPAARPASAANRIAAATPGRPPEEAVRAILEAQQAAWNAGDLDGFMAGYWKDDGLRFASGGNVARGYKAALNRYRKNYPDQAAMGALNFSEIDVQLIGDDHAVVFGGWALSKADGTQPNGLFTLVMRKSGGVWRIVHDHTSAAS
ncbi:MAG: SgcJ/EcaC family oxidoreductase [Pseudomonadota bacterium]